MKNSTKKVGALLSWMLALVMIVSLFTACSPQPAAPAATTEPAKAAETAAPAATAEPAVAESAAPAEDAAATDEPGGNPAKKSYHFVFVPKVIHPWYEAVKQGIEQAVAEYKEKGIEIKFEWDAPPEADVVVHSQKVQAAAAKQPDVISVSVLDQSVDGPIIDEVVGAGIAVTTFDCDAPSSKRTIFVGHSKNEQDGYELGKKLAELIGGKGEVAMLIGSLSAPNHIERSAGFRKAMTEFPDIKIVSEQADNDSLEKAISLTENILKSYPNLNGIFCCNAGNPVGAARAISDAGKAGQIKIVGMDDDKEAIKYCEQNVIQALKVQNVKDIGYYSIKFMIDVADGKSVSTEYPTGSYFVTPENVKEYHENTGN